MVDDFIQKTINQKLQALKSELKTELLKELGGGASPWMSRKESASYLRVSIASIDNYVRWGLLEKHMIGRSTKFKRADLDKLLR
ncbi:MAG: helix-turn-helix domain-containing protein [Rhizobiaceae bacterium]